MKKIVNITQPSVSEIERYLKLWTSLENYVLQESSLKKLFTKTYPFNLNMDDVLIKVCALNDFYSTNIFYPFHVARHIVDLNIDERLCCDDFQVVDDIALVQIDDKTKYLYSFATKYCSHHKPLVYPIYDNFVEKVLLHFHKSDKFYNFKKEDLKIYKKYRQVLDEFRSYYHLDQFTFKEIDKYLWQVGKEHFPKNYKKIKTN